MHLIVLRCHFGSDNPKLYVFWILAEIILPLKLSKYVYDFGNCPVHMPQKNTVRLTNVALKSIDWLFAYQSVSFTSRNANLVAYELVDPCVEFYPPKGSLKAGQSQLIDILYTANSQCVSESLFRLFTDNAGYVVFPVRGTGADVNILVEDLDCDFGGIRIGHSCVHTFSLRNTGLIKTNFFIDTQSETFTVEPELGVLKTGESIMVHVIFRPKWKGLYSCNMLISPHAKGIIEKIAIERKLYGTASFPDIHVYTTIINFDIAIFHSRNVRSIVVENKGDADAELSFNCIHANIKLEADSIGSSLIVPAMRKKEFLIVYTPQVMEALNVKFFIKSADNRGEVFVIAVKGLVGLPSLKLGPAGIFEDFRFGVVKLQKTAQKTFQLINDGTMFLHLEINLSRIETGGDSKTLNVVPPFTISPEHASLGVGEELTVTVLFLPTIIMDFNYRICVTFEGSKLLGTLSGSGGHVQIGNSVLQTLDYGNCRIGKGVKKSMIYSNTGNMDFKFIVRPEPSNGDWRIYDEEIEQINLEEEGDIQANLLHNNSSWIEELSALGFYVETAIGFCKAGIDFEIPVEFKPSKDKPAKKKMRVFYSRCFESFELEGVGTYPLLVLKEKNTTRAITSEKIVDIDLGIHPVHTSYVHYFDLVNNGSLAVDFIIEPMSSDEFYVSPCRGTIRNGSVQIQVYFEPSSESYFSTTLCIFWEGNSTKARISGTGGTGNLEIAYHDESDLNGFDFGMLPFNSYSDKAVVLVNKGLVGIYADCSTANTDFGLRKVGENIPVLRIPYLKARLQENLLSWSSDLKVYLPPQEGIEIAVRYTAKTASISSDNFKVVAGKQSFNIPLKGKAGTLSLSHKGDLQFGDISCNYQFQRKITIANSGSIPSKLTCTWLIVGRNINDQGQNATVQLSERYTSIDPRSQWVRSYYCDLHKLSKDITFSGFQNWGLIRVIIHRNSFKFETLMNSRAGQRMEAKQSRSNTASSYGFIQPQKRLGAIQGHSVYLKSRQIFFQLITQNQLSSQQSFSNQFIHMVQVTPATIHIASYGEVNLLVDLNLPNEDALIATLVINSDIPNTKQYEIPLLATPKRINIFCDDTRILNFYWLPVF